MRITILCLLSLTLLMSQPINASSKPVIKIGVLAKRGAEHTLKKWSPTADYLSKHLNQYQFKIIPLPFKDIFTTVKEKKIDFILANSGFYVELEYKFGVQRITTLVNKHIPGIFQKEFGGVIFTHIDNKERFNTIDDLVGSDFAAVNQRSLGGWQMAWRELVERELDKDDLNSLTFKGTHDKVVYAVLNKESEVGTVRTDTLERMALENKIDLKKFHIINHQKNLDFPFFISTRLYPEWPFAKLKHTSSELSKKVAIALMQMQPNDKAAIKANIYHWNTPLSYQPVHDCFKILKIEPYFQVIKFWDVLAKYWHWVIFYILLTVGGISMFLYQLRLTGNLKDTQDELVQTEKMAALGRLVAGIAHEINTPIGIGVTAGSYLKQETQSFKKEYKNDKLTKQSFETYLGNFTQSSDIILTNLERAAQLIQSFKQISVDQSSDETRTFFLNEYLTSIITSLKPTLKLKDHTIDVICANDLQIESKPGVFYQIFSNFIINSVIHGFENKDHGHIIINVKKKGLMLEIIYKDDGNGLSKANLDKIFDPFFTTKRGQGGSGLGTHIAYNLITQKLGGAITADSTEGKGLTYTIQFKDITYL